MNRLTPEERLEKQRREALRFSRLLARLEREPDAIIDVGVRAGTPWLYETFAGAKFVLLDPQEGGEALMSAKPEGAYVFINKAAGRAPGRMALNEQGVMSTFLTRNALTQVKTRKRYEAEIVTLDAVIDEHLPGARKIGLKIDTEGFELEVLAGLERHIERIDFIVSEASVLNRFENSYNFSELVVEMWKKGFRFYNVMNRTMVEAPRIYDVLFLRKDDAAFC